MTHPSFACMGYFSILLLVASICGLLGRWSGTGATSLSPHLRRDNRIRPLHDSLTIEQIILSLQQITAALGRECVFGKLEERSEKILALLRSKSRRPARILAERLGISLRAVEKQIAKLRKQGHMRRIGPAKGGHWEVMQ